MRRLSVQEWSDILGAAPRVVVVWALLPLVRVRRLRAWFGGRAAVSGAAVDAAPWRRRALAIRRVGARLPGCRCLARSLALGWWMGSHGVAHRLCIGVAGGEIGVRSHSWVEAGGEVIDDDARVVSVFREVVRF